VASTGAHHKPELAFDPGGRYIKVLGSVNHMINPHAVATLPRAVWMRVRGPFSPPVRSSRPGAAQHVLAADETLERNAAQRKRGVV
jgi:hypothetical protein